MEKGGKGRGRGGRGRKNENMNLDLPGLRKGEKYDKNIVYKKRLFKIYIQKKNSVYHL